MEIKKQINGKEVGFKFTPNTIWQFSQIRECEFSDIFPDENDYEAKQKGKYKGNCPFVLDPIGAIIDLYYCAVITYNKGDEYTDGKKISIYDIGEYYMELSAQDHDDIMACYIEFIKVLGDKFSTKEVKKK